jgi:hypothetical protein
MSATATTEESHVTDVPGRAGLPSLPAETPEPKRRAPRKSAATGKRLKLTPKNQEALFERLDSWAMAYGVSVLATAIRRYLKVAKKREAGRAEVERMEAKLADAKKRLGIKDTVTTE